MTFLVVGLNHRHAPVDLRSRFAFDLDKLVAPLHGLRDRLSHLWGHPEVVLLSTCNRFELYCAGDTGIKDAAITWLAAMGGISRGELLNHAYVFEGSNVANHAFRVASGLDSMVIGETQILGQMKQAVRKANAAGCVGTLLNQLFQQTFSVAKRVRTATGIGEQAVSVASTAARLVTDLSKSGKANRTLLAGAGETMELVAKHLLARAPGSVAAVANRSFVRGARLASRCNAESLNLPDISARLQEFDVVIVCTASPVPIIDVMATRRALTARDGRSMLFIDLAVPRNIEPGVGDLQGAALWSVDDLAKRAQAGNDKRHEAAACAQVLIDRAVADFDEWMEQRGAVPLIRALQAQADSWRAVEIAQARRRLARGQDIDSILNALSLGLTNKMLHGVMSELRTADRQRRPKLAKTVSQLFLRCPVSNPAIDTVHEPRTTRGAAIVLDFPVRRQAAGHQPHATRNRNRPDRAVKK